MLLPELYALEDTIALNEGLIRALASPPLRIAVLNLHLDQDLGEQQAGPLMFTPHHGLSTYHIVARQGRLWVNS